MFRRLLCVMSSVDKKLIPPHGSADNDPDGAQLEQGDIYLKLPDNGHLTSLVAVRSLSYMQEGGARHNAA